LHYLLKYQYIIKKHIYIIIFIEMYLL